MVALFRSRFLQPVLSMTWLRGFRPMENSCGDRASPRYLLHVMMVCAVGLKLVFHSS